MRRVALLALGAAVALSLAVPPVAADTGVTIQNSGCGASTYCFVPSSASVGDAMTVTWTNQSGTNHTVTRCTPGACSGTGAGTGTDSTFTSGNVNAPNGSMFSHTFHGPGTYNYYCQIHGYQVMHGTI